MIITARIRRDLLGHVVKDLERPHPFAEERVGFLSTRTGYAGSGNLLILFSEYFPIPDNQYVQNTEVGACIDATAIREAMQRTLSTGCGTFHVHKHFLPGPLGFSAIDQQELSRLMPSFLAVAPESAHGALLLGSGDCRALAWHHGKKHAANVSRISIVGYPLQFTRRR